MSNLKIFKKVLSAVLCTAVSLGVTVVYPAASPKEDVSAKTIAEIQEQRKANQEKIQALEADINYLEGNKANEKAYQETLSEQIDYIQENIDLLNKELEKIGNDIQTTQDNITVLDGNIETQQTAIDENIELFKKRLCAMYINGNDSMAAVVLGSASFYDMMSRVQMVNSIAEYDEELINNILDEIDSLEKSKKDLETEKLNLQMKLEDQEKRKEEKAEEIETLNVKMRDTQDEIDRIAREQESLERNKSDIEAENKQLAAEEAEIEEQIRKAAEEAQRRREEEERKAAAERTAAAQAAAEAAAAAAAAAAQNNSDNSSQTPSYTVPDTPPVVENITYSTGFIWPAPGFSYISSPYGYRWGTTHRGIDIGDSGIGGGTAVASQAGTVITVNNSCTHNYAKSSSCGCGGGYGNYVVISHDGTYSTLYGHLATAYVSVGDYVQQGQAIGAIGCTGFSTGDHLHFEVRVNGVANDPLSYVSP